MPSLRFISGSGTGSNVAQGVVGQIAALNTSITNLSTIVSSITTAPPSITFLLNGKTVTVTNPDPQTKLVDYIRYSTPYYGTKKMCAQGGCGVCAVMISYYDAADGVLRNVSVNSCLKTLVSCDGLAITTTEGIGRGATKVRQLLGANGLPNGFGASDFHPVQERIVKAYGLQCGACTAGMVMTMYTALQPNTFMQNYNTPTLIEKNLDGNICRCSCFPGLIKASRSFLPTGAVFSPHVYNASGALIGYDLNATGANDASATGSEYYLANSTMKNMKGFTAYNPANDINANTYSSWLQGYNKSSATFVSPFGYSVYRASAISDAATFIQQNNVSTTEVIANRTSWGVPGFDRNQTTKTFVDVTNIAELNTISTGASSITFGANVPINKAVKTLLASSDSKFNAIGNHWFYISGNHVRNAAALCGSLMMAKKGNFASDVAPVLMAAGATLNVTYVYQTYSQNVSNLSIEDFMALSLADKVLIIRSITIPARATGEYFDSYRVAIRPVNSHALINSSISIVTSGTTITSAKVVYGALTNSQPVHATTVEAYLVGKTFTTAGINSWLPTALSNISSQISTADEPAFKSVAQPDAKTSYRNSLALSLFYMFMIKGLQFNGQTVAASIASGVENWIHLTRQANLEYVNMLEDQSNVQLWPIHFSLPLTTNFNIASGEGQFSDDVPNQAGQLFMDLVPSTIAVGAVDWNHPTTVASLAAARAYPGVEAVLTAKDFPYYAAGQYTTLEAVELLGDKRINWYGKPVAAVYATSPEVAKFVAANTVFAYTGSTTTRAMPISGGVYPSSGFPVGVQEALALNSDYKNTDFEKNYYENYAYAAPDKYPSPMVVGDAAWELNPTFLRTDVNGNNLNYTGSNTGSFTGPGYYYYATGVTGSNGYYYAATGHIVSPYISTGSLFINNVHHMYMEKQTSVCYLDDNGTYVLYTSTQRPQYIVQRAAPVFGINQSQLIIRNKRVGGAFGGKMSAANVHIALLVMFGVWKTGRCVRSSISLSNDFSVNGAENEMYNNYTVGFNSDGSINSINTYSVSPSSSGLAITFNPGAGSFDLCVVSIQLADLSSWIASTYIKNKYSSYDAVLVPRSPYSPYRANGSRQQNQLESGVIMFDIATKLGITPTEVGVANYVPADATYAALYNKLITEPAINWSTRRSAVQTFNTQNKWKKRALELSFGTYKVSQDFASSHDVMIRIVGDGSVYVTLGSNELGQGIYEKVIQMISQRLKCPPTKIFIKDYDATVNSSSASELASVGTNIMLAITNMACEKMLNLNVSPSFTGAYANSGANGLLLRNLYGTNINGDTVVMRSDNGDMLVDDTHPNGFVLSGHTGTDFGSADMQAWELAWYRLVYQTINYQLSASDPYYAAPILWTAGWQLGQNSYPSALASTFSGASQAYGPLGRAATTNELCVVADGRKLKRAVVSSKFITATQVEVDVLTGNIQVLETDFVYDFGSSFNPMLDVGQLQGSYIFGLGNHFSEERSYQAGTAKPLITDTWNYKPPSSVNTPSIIRTYALANVPDNSDQPTSLSFGAKVANEMGMHGAVSAFTSVKQAIRYFREQEQSPALPSNFQLDVPATVDRIKQACGNITNLMTIA